MSRPTTFEKFPSVASVRNPEGYWINTQLFRTEALHFQKYGYYCSDPYLSPAWKHYWETQLTYCKEGFSVGGVKITGHHYYYLNFNQIKLVELGVTTKAAKKKKLFPYFWDGDYNYFWVKNIARFGTTLEEYLALGLEVKILPDYFNGGYHVIVGKARRKGYSYKNAAVAANTYNTMRDSLCMFVAYDKKYLFPKGTMAMATDSINFLNEHTGWKKKRQVTDSVDHRKASYIIMDDMGFPIEKGYKSEIMAISFRDNPDASRGKDSDEIFFEESGKFPNLQEAFMSTDDTARAGIHTTGQITVFGTSGDMDRDSVAFANMFYNAKGFGFLPIVNIWDDGAENTTCGFFHPVTMNWEGFFDENGNSDKQAALQFELDKRTQLVKNANSLTALQQRMMENPIKPSEAFLNISVNNFPIHELRLQLTKVITQELHVKMGQPGYFILENNKPVFKADLSNKLQPIYHFPNKEVDLSGCVVIYEAPKRPCPKGTYIIGYDPYRQNIALDSSSFGVVYVYKKVFEGDFLNHIIVAEYVGRPANMDTYNRNVEMLAEYYNAEILYENEVTSVLSYFEKRKKLHLLAAQPDNLISSVIKVSKVSRVFGMHMVEKLKEAGEKYINTWLLTERDTDEHGNKILNLHTIHSKGLLEELISYNRKGNFDRVMAFMFVMFQLEADSIINPNHERNKYIEQVAQDLLELNNNLYKR